MLLVCIFLHFLYCNSIKKKLICFIAFLTRVFNQLASTGILMIFSQGKVTNNCSLLDLDEVLHTFTHLLAK